MLFASCIDIAIMSSGTEPPVVYSPSDTKTPQLMGVLVGTTGLALISFGMRAWVRLKLVKSFGWDDYTMAMAVVGVVSPSGSFGLG